MEPTIYVVQQLPPDFWKEPEQFTLCEAKRYYEWYMGILPQRVTYLTQTCAAGMNVPIEHFTHFPDCCKALREWFLRRAALQETTEEEQRQMRLRFGHLGAWWIHKERLSDFTELVLRDIGMFLGDSLVRYAPSLRWSLITKPKSYVNVNKPHIIGFSQNNIFEPIHMARVQATKMLDGKQSPTDLFDIIIFWLTML